MKIALIVIGAVLANIGLLLLMENMVGRDRVRIVNTMDAQTIDFVRTPQDEQTKTKDRRRKPPPKPEELKKPQAKMDQMQTQDMELPSPMEMLAVNSLMTADGVAIGGRMVGGDGGQLQTIMERDLTAISKIPPQYPTTALMRGLEGYVEMIFLVRPDGTVGETRLVASEPPGRFDQAAQDAVRRWRYRPFTVDGVAQSAWVRVTVEFKLDE